MRAALQPREVARRHQAVMNLWNSRRTSGAANDAGAAAGFSLAVPAKSRNGHANLPPVRVAAPADFSPPSGVALPGLRLVVSYEFARRWAVANGLCHRRNAMDLKVVNAVRRERSLVLFVLKGLD